MEYDASVTYAGHVWVIARRSFVLPKVPAALGPSGETYPNWPYLCQNCRCSRTEEVENNECLQSPVLQELHK